MPSGDARAGGRYVIAFDLTDDFKGVDKTLPADFFRKVSVEFEVTDKEMPLHIPLAVHARGLKPARCCPAADWAGNCHFGDWGTV